MTRGKKSTSWLNLPKILSNDSIALIKLVKALTKGPRAHSRERIDSKMEILV